MEVWSAVNYVSYVWNIGSTVIPLFHTIHALYKRAKESMRYQKITENVFVKDKDMQLIARDLRLKKNSPIKINKAGRIEWV